ncbi:hypothetical protein Agub_g12532, partial [Astrephomene gubernaculifera]
PGLVQLGYWRGELAHSDHKPVAALFSAAVLRYDRRRLDALLAAARREVDRLQESLRPRVSVSPVCLDAGEWVAAGRPVRLRMLLRNEGGVEAVWHWVPPPRPPTPAPLPPQQGQQVQGLQARRSGAGSTGGGGGGAAGGGMLVGLLDDDDDEEEEEGPALPPWLSSQPAEGVLAPGQTCEVVLTVLVEGGPGGAAGELMMAAPATPAAAAVAATAVPPSAAAPPAAVAAVPSSPSPSSPLLPPGPLVPLECIAILRVEDAGDKFISIAGRHVRSFLGLPLPALAQLGRTPLLPPALAQQLAAQLGLPPLQLQPQEEQPQQQDEQQQQQPQQQDCSAPGVCAGGLRVLPKEVAALLAALRAGGGAALRTPGVLVDSAALVLLRAGAAEAEAAGAAEGVVACTAGVGAVGGTAGGGGGDEEAAEAEAAEAMQPRSVGAQRALVRELSWLRLHLDAGGQVPPGTPPHALAALLLLWCGQLPYTLIPAAAADAAAAAPPASAADAVALLRTHCDPHQLAAVSELIRLFRTALAPAAAACNGLTAARLAVAVGAWWLPPLAAGAAADAGRNRRALLTVLLTEEEEVVVDDGERPEV